MVFAIPLPVPTRTPHSIKYTVKGISITYISKTPTISIVKVRELTIKKGFHKRLCKYSMKGMFINIALKL